MWSELDLEVCGGTRTFLFLLCCNIVEQAKGTFLKSIGVAIAFHRRHTRLRRSQLHGTEVGEYTPSWLKI